MWTVSRVTNQREATDRKDRVSRAVLPILVSVAAMLMTSACADRSYALPPTSAVESWRLWLGVACGVLIVVWIALLGVIGISDGPTSTDALGNLVTGVVITILA